MFQSDSVAASTLTIEERKPDSSVHTIYGRDIEENDLSPEIDEFYDPASDAAQASAQHDWREFCREHPDSCA